jgi:hypothetical protein
MRGGRIWSRSPHRARDNAYSILPAAPARSPALPPAVLARLGTWSVSISTQPCWPWRASLHSVTGHQSSGAKGTRRRCPLRRPPSTWCAVTRLQFFPDRLAALRDVRRVLVPGGRLALGVWRRLEHQPFYAALTDALERYVSAQAAASLRAAFILGDAPALRALVADAGFREIHIRLRSRLTRWPSLEDYVFGYLAGSPMAPAVAALDDTARTAMLEHITAALQSYVDDDGLAAPWESHVVTAHA